MNIEQIRDALPDYARDLKLNLGSVLTTAGAPGLNEKQIWSIALATAIASRNTGFARSIEVNSRAYCGAFNFKGTDQQNKVGNLSGGQRNRVHLAKMLKSGGNVLLLDEPTNDLDTETLGALEDALEDFAGCAVIISHDRMFLDRLATHILAFEGDSHVEWFEGNFEDYEEDKIRRLGAEAANPKRATYKRLTR